MPNNILFDLQGTVAEMWRDALENAQREAAEWRRELDAEIAQSRAEAEREMAEWRREAAEEAQRAQEEWRDLLGGGNNHREAAPRQQQQAVQAQSAIQQISDFHKAIVKATIAIELDDEVITHLKLEPQVIHQVIIDNKKPSKAFLKKTFKDITQEDSEAIGSALTSLKEFAKLGSRDYNFRDSNQEPVTYSHEQIASAVVEGAQKLILGEILGE